MKAIEARNKIYGQNHSRKATVSATARNSSSVPWTGEVSHVSISSKVVTDFAELELRIVASMSPFSLHEMGEHMFGKNEMCGDCIRVKLMTQHDPNTDPRRVCPLCRTVWPGYEPGNRRREAVMATRAKRRVRDDERI